MVEKRHSVRSELTATLMVKRLDSDENGEEVTIDITDVSKGGVGFTCNKALQIGAVYESFLEIWTKEVIHAFIEIIRIEKEHERATVYAKKYISGKIRYFDIKVQLVAGMDLKESLVKAAGGYATNSVIRVTLSGTVSKEDYEVRKKTYDEVLGKYLTFEVNDDELSEEITIEKIRSDFAETSFAAQFLEQLIDEPTELQMAYKMLQECIE